MVKGVFYLLRALRHAVGIEITIVGTGDARLLVEQYCVRHQITERVTLKGYVSANEKLNLLRHSKYLVHLSSGEGIPCIAAMEAAEQGCTIIMHNDGRGDIEALPNDFPAIVTDRRNPKELAKLLSELSKSGLQKERRQDKFAPLITSNYSANSVAQIINDTFQGRK